MCDELRPEEVALSIKTNHAVITPQILATQVGCYHLAKRKFPSIHKSGMLYTRQMLEQSSGEAILNYKSSLFSGDTAIDLTGGLGMDTYMLSLNYNHVHSVEMDEEVFKLTRHNHSKLGVKNCTYHNSKCELFLQEFDERAELVYVDPSRRDKNRKVFLLEDSSPNIFDILPMVKNITNRFVIKLSPLYDITQLLRDFDQVANIFVISVSGEVKELLVEMYFDIDPNHRTKINAVLLDKEGNKVYEVEEPVIDHTHSNEPTDPTQFLFEPDAAIIKSRLTSKVASDFGLTFVNMNTDYLTGHKPIQTFPGKFFKIIEIQSYNPKKLKKRFNELGLNNVHIHKRDFPTGVEDLFKKFKLKMGEDAHLFFTKDRNQKPIVLICEF